MDGADKLTGAIMVGFTYDEARELVDIWRDCQYLAAVTVDGGELVCGIRALTAALERPIDSIEEQLWALLTCSVSIIRPDGADASGQDVMSREGVQPYEEE